MNTSRFGASMMIYKAAKTILISRDTAIILASNVVRDYFGQDDLDFQSPFRVEEQDDIWLIHGTGKLDPVAERNANTRKGRLKMAISKYTGEILQLEH